jgi:two-component system cell cycle response regulator DivK
VLSVVFSGSEPVKDEQTILLVDNKADVRETLGKIAGQLGLRLLLAEDGQEGLDIAKSENPDIIMIRRNAPILDALSMSVLLKQSDKTRDIPVVVICSDASPSELERFQDAGCSYCLKEPFTTDELNERLKDWLP